MPQIRLGSGRFRRVRKVDTAASRTTGRIEFIALVSALMGLNSIAIDIILPGLPAVSAALHVSGNAPQLIIAAFPLGFAITTVLGGPLADRFGRRTPLLVGIGIYIVAALLGPFASDLGTLLLLRLVQGIGAGTVRISQAIVRDRYSGDEMAEIFSLSLMAFLILPVVAPAIGQAILLVGTWQDIFYLMGALGLAIWVWVYLRLPETLRPEARRPFNLAGIAGSLRLVFAQRAALGYGFAAMFLLGALFGLINSAQQIYVGLFGLGVWFPVAFAVIAGLQSIAAFVNSRLVRRHGAWRVGRLSLQIYTALSAVMAAASVLGWLPFPVFFVLLAGIMCMFSWADSNLAALSMEPLGEVAGTASSAFGAIQTVGAALLGAIIGQSYDGTTTPLAVGYLLMGLLALGAVGLGKRSSRLQQPHIPE